MTENIYPQQKTFIIQTIKKIFPEAKIYAFGSRISGDAKTYSDLDLALDLQGEVSFNQLAILRQAFSESDIPFHVDIIDFHQVNDEFKKIILQSSYVWE